MTSVEVTTESAQLSDGMLGIIGAYGMHGALDVHDLYGKTARESASAEDRLATAERHAGAAAPLQASR
jgi:hypothetical protein